MKTLNELINELSPEELSIHKDLISECVNRQYEIDTACVDLKANMERFTTITETLYTNLEKLQEECNNLNKNLTDYKNLSILRSIKDEDFFKE